MRPVCLQVLARDGAARTGVARTARGSFETPCFMPVGTRGTVKLLDAADLDRLAPQVVLANTYHLMLRPGAEAVAAMGGLHRFTGWHGLFLSDSGGFQVYSLAPRVDDEGVTFRSIYDGSYHRLTPEGAVTVQEDLGADIQMVLDVCSGLPAPEETIRLSTTRTEGWARRARAAHSRTDQSLFGIVQGGTVPRLRAESAARVAALEFDGYGIGGLSVGEPRDEMLPALAGAISALPEDRPRYLMGVGDPVSIVEAVALGVDMFDCVMPTRLARHGTALTGVGKVQVKSARFARSDAALDESCSCLTCRRYPVGYLRHLLTVGEPTAGRLITLHNLAWMESFTARIRAHIDKGTLSDLRIRVREAWKPTSLR